MLKYLIKLIFPMLQDFSQFGVEIIILEGIFHTETSSINGCRFNVYVRSDFEIKNL